MSSTQNLSNGDPSSSSSSTTAATAKDKSIQEWGSHCSLKSCNMLDFLPIKCSSCFKPFCSEHFKPSTNPNELKTHQCQIFILEQEQSKDSNLRPTTIPKKDESRTKRPICSEKNCRTQLIQPIRCPDCRLEYCTRHRLNSDHNCESQSNNIKKGHSQNNVGKAFKEDPLNFIRNHQQNFFNNLQQSNPSSRSKTDTDSSFSKPNQNQKVFTNRKDEIKGSDPNKSSNSTGIISKIVDNKRANQELESKKKALEFRAKKGILTEKDKSDLIELERSLKNSTTKSSKNFLPSSSSLNNNIKQSSKQVSSLKNQDQNCIMT